MDFCLAISGLPGRALCAGLSLAIALSVQAQQYRWVDEKGRVQYTGTPPPASAKSVQKKNLNTGPANPTDEPYALQVARKNAPVKLYSSPECGIHCEDARKLLNQRGIPFAEISVTDTAQLEELKTVSGGSVVPVMLVGRTMYKGFSEERYQGALDTAGYPKTGSLRPRSQAAPPPPKPPAETPDAPATSPAAEPAKPRS